MDSLEQLRLDVVGSDPNKRKLAADQLGSLGTPEAQTILIRALSNTSTYVRINAAEALGQGGGDVCVPALIEALESDPVPNVRQCAARSLGDLKAANAVSALLAALEDSDLRVARAAARALGQIGDIQAEEKLLHLITHDDPLLRQASAQSLGLIGSSASARHLIGALDDPKWIVRQAAAEALGRLGDPLTIPALELVLQDEREIVRVAALRALKMIRDQILGEG